MVFLGHPQPARTDDRGRAPDQAPLARCTLRWFDSKIANGLIEGINSLVQAAKAKARGYRSTRNLKAMVYLLAGKLNLRTPGLAHPKQRGTRIFASNTAARAIFRLTFSLTKSTTLPILRRRALRPYAEVKGIIRLSKRPKPI